MNRRLNKMKMRKCGRWKQIEKGQSSNQERTGAAAAEVGVLTTAERESNQGEMVEMKNYTNIII